MDAKKIEHILKEFSALFVGSDDLASDFLYDLLPELYHYAEEDHTIILSEDRTEMELKCCQAMDLAQPQLNLQWRLALIANLFTLVAADIDPTPLLRRARGNIDFLKFQSSDRILHANTEIYKELATTISAKAVAVAANAGTSSTDPQNIDHGQASKQSASSLSPQLAMVRAMAQRESVMQLARHHFSPSPSTSAPLPLSPKASYYHDLSRNRSVFQNVPQEYVQFVLRALDKEQVWLNISTVISTGEILWVMYSVACEIRDMATGRYKGNLWQFVQYEEDSYAVGGGSDDVKNDIDFDRETDEYILPVFREQLSPKGARMAQGMYDYGITEEEAIRTAKEIPLMEEEDRARKDSHNTLFPVDSQRDYLDKLRELNAGHDDQGQASTYSSRIGEESEKRALEIVELFGDNVSQLFSIDVGLTRLLRADAKDIEAELNLAFTGKLKEEEVGKVGNTWTYKRNNEKVWMVALSYKHKSRQVRMASETVKKVSLALAEIARLQGCDEVVIWVDAILSSNKNLSNGNWAVNGLYPYLTGDVVRVIGKDGDYDDCDEASMWMQVERDCANKRSLFTLTVDKSARGYSWEMKDSGDVSLHDRILGLAAKICKGSLNDKLVSWRQDKVKLILWAEACMISGQPLLMDEEQLAKMSTLRIDNMPDSEMETYINLARQREFVRTTPRNRGSLAPWLGLFELFPGLYEATRREFRGLFPLIGDVDMVCGGPSEVEGRWRIFGIIGGVAVNVEVNRAEKRVLQVGLDAYRRTHESMQEANEYWKSSLSSAPVHVTGDEEEDWYK